MKLVSKTFKFSKRLSRFVYKRFEILSWVFTIILIISLAFTVNGLYNLAVYGTCDPHSDFCVFNPDIGISCGSEHCATEGCECGPTDTYCTEETGFAPCEGNCSCNEAVCG